jgi:hypothetical protein
MNSLYENRNSLESREQLLARLGDAICSECGYLAYTLNTLSAHERSLSNDYLYNKRYMRNT